MGWKSRVFHTAPPQPASNARRTWAPELVGGALANQKGLGEWMPQVSVARLGLCFISLSPFSVEEVRDATSGDLALLDRIDDLGALADAITARVEA